MQHHPSLWQKGHKSGERKPKLNLMISNGALSKRLSVHLLNKHLLNAYHVPGTVSSVRVDLLILRLVEEKGLFIFIRSVITSYHSWGGFKDKFDLSHISGDWKSKTEVPEGLNLLEPAETYFS